jgi:hypothetical protein
MIQINWTNLECHVQVYSTKKECKNIKHFHLECQNSIKNIKECSISTSMFLMFLSKPLECSFVINKINLIVLINTSFFMKKNQDSNINFKKIGDLSY